MRNKPTVSTEIREAILAEHIHGKLFSHWQPLLFLCTQPVYNIVLLTVLVPTDGTCVSVCTCSNCVSVSVPSVGTDDGV